MKALLATALLAATIFSCNLFKSKSTADIRPLFNALPLLSANAETIDRALGKPTKVVAPFVALDESRSYALSDGSTVDFDMKNNRPVQVLFYLKSGAETSRQALKYAGIDIGNIPTSRASKSEDIWNDVTLEGKRVHLGVMKDTTDTGAMVRMFQYHDATSDQRATQDQTTVSEGSPRSSPMTAASDDRALLQEIMGVEERWRNAMRDRDMATLNALTAAEFINSAEGTTQTRAESIAAIRGGTNVGWYKIRNPRLINQSTDQVTITVEVTAKANSGEILTYRDINTWVRRDGRWQISKSKSVDL
jgi:hypothetical protein